MILPGNFLTTMLLTLCLAMVSLSGWSQPTYGVYFGYSASSWSGDNIPGVRIRPGSGFKTGLSAEFRVTNETSILFQPGFLQEQGRILFRDDSTSMLVDSLRLRTRLVVFPIFLKVLALNERLYFTTGLEPGYQIDSEVRQRRGNEKVAITDFTEDFHLAFDFGIGYRFKINRSWLNIEWRYHQGLTNVLVPEADIEFLLRSKLVSTRLVAIYDLPIGTRRKGGDP